MAASSHCQTCHLRPHLKPLPIISIARTKAGTGATVWTCVAEVTVSLNETCTAFWRIASIRHSWLRWRLKAEACRSRLALGCPDCLLPNLTAAMQTICIHAEVHPTTNVSCNTKSSAVLQVSNHALVEVARRLVFWMLSPTSFVGASFHWLKIHGWPPVTKASETRWIEPCEIWREPGSDALFTNPHLTAANAIFHALAARLIRHTQRLAVLHR